MGQGSSVVEYAQNRMLARIWYCINQGNGVNKIESFELMYPNDATLVQQAWTNALNMVKRANGTLHKINIAIPITNGRSTREEILAAFQTVGGDIVDPSHRVKVAFWLPQSALNVGLEQHYINLYTDIAKELNERYGLLTDIYFCKNAKK